MIKQLRPKPKPVWHEHEGVHQYELIGSSKLAHVFAATVENQGKFFYRASVRNQTLEGYAPTLETAQNRVEIFVERLGGLN
jgi:hypothetical protein